MDDRHLDGWHSPALGQGMPIAAYGHWGHPLLLFPTAAADYLENERFGLVGALAPQIEAGRVRVFSINSINQQAWMDDKLPVGEQARRQALYSAYVEDEVVPYIRGVCRSPELRVATAGASFGAFHAANALFRRPELFDGVIAMSGFYDLAGDYLRGYCDDNCYFNNPAWYLANLEGERLELLRTSCQIHVLTGQGAWEAPDASRQLSELLDRKGIPHLLDLWGHDVAHDWPWWRKMLPYAIDRMGW
ncbi:MAG TPA: alpha/beta hydrolase-fold protein [Thermoanaerobaculia bacterium]